MCGMDLNPRPGPGAEPVDDGGRGSTTVAPVAYSAFPDAVHFGTVAADRAFAAVVRITPPIAADKLSLRPSDGFTLVGMQDGSGVVVIPPPAAGNWRSVLRTTDGSGLQVPIDITVTSPTTERLWAWPTPPTEDIVREKLTTWARTHMMVDDEAFSGPLMIADASHARVIVHRLLYRITTDAVEAPELPDLPKRESPTPGLPIDPDRTSSAKEWPDRVMPLWEADLLEPGSVREKSCDCAGATAGACRRCGGRGRLFAYRRTRVAVMALSAGHDVGPSFHGLHGCYVRVDARRVHEVIKPDVLASLLAWSPPAGLTKAMKAEDLLRCSEFQVAPAVSVAYDHEGQTRTAYLVGQDLRVHAPHTRSLKHLWSSLRAPRTSA